MAYCPELTEVGAQVSLRRRRFPRQTLRSLAYVKLDQANGGIIRDLTERGIAIQAVAPLRAGQEVSIRFDLFAPRVRIDVRGRVAWGDVAGQSGIEFVDLPPRMRRALRDWLLFQMLSAATISGRDSMFASQSEGELTFSPVTAPAIRVEPRTTELLPEPIEDRIRWAWFRLSSRQFACFVDGLVLLCAVLIFSISSILVMGGIPVWPLALGLFLTSSTIFVAIYQILFSDLLCGASPGVRLAHMAANPAIFDDREPLR